PRLRRIIWTSPGGALLADVEAKEPNPEGEWRESPARVTLGDGTILDCTFATEARFFAELDESRDVAEWYKSMATLRPQIQRSYLEAFAALLIAWVVLAGASGIFLARRTTRRIAALIGAVRELARGNLAVQVDPGGAKDEVAGLARAFNAMV